MMMMIAQALSFGWSVVQEDDIKVEEDEAVCARPCREREAAAASARQSRLPRNDHFLPRGHFLSFLPMRLTAQHVVSGV